MDIELIITVAVIAVIAVVLIRILTKPIKFIFKLALHAASGYVVLFLINNFVGEIFHFYIEPTLINMLITGICGIPGVIFLLLFG